MNEIKKLLYKNGIGSESAMRIIWESIGGSYDR